jgi:hypothetical protein
MGVPFDRCCLNQRCTLATLRASSDSWACPYQMKCPDLVADHLSGFVTFLPEIGMRPEVRLARYVEALEPYRVGRLSWVEAGVSC